MRIDRGDGPDDAAPRPDREDGGDRADAHLAGPQADQPEPAARSGRPAPNEGAAHAQRSVAYRHEAQAVYRAYAIDQGCAEVEKIETDTVTPAMLRIEAADATRCLIGFENRLKGKDRLAQKVENWMAAQPGLQPDEASPFDGHDCISACGGARVPTIGGRSRSGDRTLRGGRMTRISVAAAVVGSVGALLLSAGSAGSANRAHGALAKGSSVPVAQAAAASPTGRTFDGVAAVGALFIVTNGKLSTHFCTASVVNSPAGDLALTAAHCVYGRTQEMAFVPGYVSGRTPYGIWRVTKVYTDSAWDSAQDPDHDVAFLKLADAPDGVPIENVTGAETLGTDLPAGELVQVIGYPDDASAPVWCSGVAKGFSATQLEFDCGGYPVGTSGGPFLADVNAATGQGTVIGVIGGYQQGGDTSAVSYAASFGSSVALLYAQATAAG